MLLLVEGQFCCGTTFADLMITGSTGTFCIFPAPLGNAIVVVLTAAMASTTSMPSVTLPKAQYPGWVLSA